MIQLYATVQSHQLHKEQDNNGNDQDDRHTAKYQHRLLV